MSAVTRNREKCLALVEDCEWIIAHGGTWESVSMRLGTNPRAVDKLLRRHHRHDLLETLTRRARDVSEMSRS